MATPVARIVYAVAGNGERPRRTAVRWMKNPVRLVAGAWDRLARADVWNVGIADAPIEAFLTPGARPPVRWLPAPPRGSSIADPFALVAGDRPVIVAERLDYGHKQGYLVALDRESGATRTVIASDVHMSYPYLVRHDGRIFCVPETGTARAVRLYEATAFPDAWVRRATLIEGFAALDPTLIRHEGRWWLFCADRDDDPDGTLHAWHAPDLFGPWTPHARNPLKRDRRTSRPGGTPFVHAGHLYRPAQDCTRTYGGAVTINRVLRLTPTEFAEEAVATVGPYMEGPYPDGLHTLAACGAQTLVDGKRRAFVGAEVRRRLRRLAAHPATVVRAAFAPGAR
jgi:hypothetical protein